MALLSLRTLKHGKGVARDRNIPAVPMDSMLHKLQEAEFEAMSYNMWVASAPELPSVNMSLESFTRWSYVETELCKFNGNAAAPPKWLGD